MRGGKCEVSRNRCFDAATPSTEKARRAPHEDRGHAGREDLCGAHRGTATAAVAGSTLVRHPNIKMMIRFVKHALTVSSLPSHLSKKTLLTKRQINMFLHFLLPVTVHWTLKATVLWYRFKSQFSPANKRFPRHFDSSAAMWCYTP